MAREKRPVQPAYEPPAQEEMTVVVVKFKGGPESMQKGFDAVNNAIASLGPAQPAHQQRVIVSRTPAQIPAAPTQNGNVIDAEIEEPESELQNAALEPPPPVAATAMPKPRKSYTFMSEFNLSPPGVPSLKEYCVGKNPQSDNDKFLIASAWIQTHGATDPFTGRHLFTAFRAMEWKTQADMTQPMRRLKSDKSYFENPSSGKWRLTGIGLEAAEKIGK
jgi:hypothetical protein